MSPRGARDLSQALRGGRRELVDEIRRFAKGLSIRLHDDAELHIGKEGILCAAAIRQSGDGLTPTALKRGADVAVVYIDIPRSKIRRGLYRCHVVGKKPYGKMTLYGANGARAGEIDATITVRPGVPAEAAICGVGVSTHIDPSGPVPTKTVCWVVTCSTSGGVSIVTGCVVSVPPG